MTVVSPINPSVLRLDAPPDLRGLQGWLIWRYETEPGTGKALKVPYWAHGGKRHGKQGSSEDRARLVTFAAARDAAAKRGFEGVGLALMPEFGITALDFDHCVRDDGTFPPEIEGIIGSTYSEYSPSGKGIRAFVRGSLGNHKSHRGAQYDWGFETFSSAGFVTFTGNPLPFTEMLGLDDYVAPANAHVLALAKQRFGTAEPRINADDPDDFEQVMMAEPLGYRLEDAVELLSDIDPSEPRDTWIQTGMALHHEFGGSEEAFDVWDEWSSGGHQYPGTEALRTQWSSFERRDPARRPITMASVRKLSNDARAARGEPPRSFDTINRAAEEARANMEETDPNRYATPDDWAGKYKVYSGGEFTSRPAPEWIIRGVLPRADLGVIFGQSGSGKSFAILDMALAICRGVEWRGLKVQQGRVLYIAAEGGGGVSQRLKAYEQHHSVKISDLPLGVVNSAPNLLLEEDVTELVKAIVVAGSGDIVIIDTLAQVVAGNENSSEDMGLALRHCRAIREATGSMVILVHHSGKDQSKGARGWSGLRGASDVEFEVQHEQGEQARVLRVSKQKDGRDDLSWAFKLEEVIIGLDPDGEPESSMVVAESEMPKPKAEEPKGKKRLGKWERVVMDAIATLEPSIITMSTEALIDVVMGTTDADPAQRDYRRQNVIRAIKSLSSGRDPLLDIAHGVVTFLGEPD